MCRSIMLLGMLASAAAMAQSEDFRSVPQSGVMMLNPDGSPHPGLWLTDYLPGDPLFYDIDAIQFRPWAKGLFDERQSHDLEPHARCKASGGVRQFLTPYGVEIVEIEELERLYIFDIGGPHTYREVYMDGRGHPADIFPSNYGHNIGWWDGDTLVVDSVGYNEDFWFERLGLPYTESVHIVETFRRVDAEAIEYTFTLDDRTAYEAPVTGRLTLYWRDEEELFEFICQQSNYADVLMVHPVDLTPIGETSPIIP